MAELLPDVGYTIDESKYDHYVFVYGTLKRGHRNHSLLASATYLGTRQTEKRYLFAVVAPGLPVVIPVNIELDTRLIEDYSASVVGELYRVNYKTLGVLDELEGHPNFYTRRNASVETFPTGGDGRGVRLNAWMYVIDYYWRWENNLRLPSPAGVHKF